MFKVPYRACLLAALSVLNCAIAAGAPSATGDVAGDISEMRNGRALVTSPPTLSLKNCSALAIKKTCKKKDMKRVNKRAEEMLKSVQYKEEGLALWQLRSGLLRAA